MIISRDSRKIPHEKINSKLTFLCFTAWLNIPWRFEEPRVLHLVSCLENLSILSSVTGWILSLEIRSVRVMSEEMEDFTERLPRKQRFLCTFSSGWPPCQGVNYRFLWYRLSFYFTIVPAISTLSTYSTLCTHQKFLTSMTPKKTDSCFERREKKGSKNTIEIKFKQERGEVNLLKSSLDWKNDYEIYE